MFMASFAFSLTVLICPWAIKVTWCRINISRQTVQYVVLQRCLNEERFFFSDQWIDLFNVFVCNHFSSLLIKHTFMWRIFRVLQEILHWHMNIRISGVTHMQGPLRMKAICHVTCLCSVWSREQSVILFLLNQYCRFGMKVSELMWDKRINCSLRKSRENENT